MNAVEALHLAEQNGVRVGVAGADLILDADREPAPKVLDAIRRNKAALVALLTASGSGVNGAAESETPKRTAAHSKRLPGLPKLPTKTKRQESVLGKSGQGWDPETAALIEWFLGTEPPSDPFRLQQAVTIAHPDKYWEYLRQDIAAGPNRARAKTGAFQENLRQVYRVLRDGKDIGGGAT